MKKDLKIVLIYPPIMKKYKPNELDIPVPHIGIAYVAALLKKEGFNVDVIDCAAQEIEMDELFKIIEKERYNIIGLSTYYFNNANVIRLVQKIKKREPETFVFLGGMLPTLSTEAVLRIMTQVDCCVVGEGEITVLEILEKIYKKQDWKTVDGIAYYKDKKVITTPKRKLIDDLDILPYPIRIKPKRENYTPILATRGCYGNCNFCSIESYYDTCIGKKVRMRDPIKVVDEIASLEQQGHKCIKFNDENFNVSSKSGKTWFNTFYTEIKKRNINVSFIMDMRVNEVIHGEDEIKKLMEIGLDFIFIGVESFIQKHLDFFRKHVTVEDNIKAMHILDRLGVNYRIGLLLFNPITTMEDIKQSLVTIRKVYYLRQENMMKPISLFQPVIAVAGTDIYNYVIDKGIYANNGRGYYFEDSNVEIYYTIMKKWAKYIENVYEKRFGCNSLEMKQIMKKIYDIDLKFLEALWIAIESQKEKAILDYEILIEKSKIQVEKLVNAFSR